MKRKLTSIHVTVTPSSKRGGGFEVRAYCLRGDTSTRYEIGSGSAGLEWLGRLEDRHAVRTASEVYRDYVELFYTRV